MAVRLKRLFGKALLWLFTDGLWQLVKLLVIWVGALFVILVFLSTNHFRACVSGTSWQIVAALSLAQVLLIVMVCFFILRRFRGGVATRKTLERLTVLAEQQNILLERLAQTQDAIEERKPQ